MRKLTKVVILGFPNVGKSTIFNRILREKKSLVHTLPGMTRDQVTALCNLGGKSFILIDTGGFFDSQEDPISTRVKEKAWEAAQEADVILFVFDGKRDLLPVEEELFLSIRKLGKPVFIIVNKIDSPFEESALCDYYRLGERQIIGISAEHKRNLDQLEESLLGVIPSHVKEKEDSEPLKIALVGRINVGKSSLVNFLCGHEKLIVSELPGTTRDSTDTIIRRNGKVYCLIDTAGIRKLSRTKDKKEKAAIIKAKKDIILADVACLIMDAQEFTTQQDSAIARLAHESGKPLVIVLNKWDLITKDERSARDFKDRCYAKMDFVAYSPILFISALTGKRVIKILNLAEQAYFSGCQRIGTSRLNSFLEWINRTHPPVSKKGKKVKIKYITQKGILPPTFTLYTHSRDLLSPAYEIFFVRCLRERFGFIGTSIRLTLKKS